jgi:tricorn protease
VNFGDVAMTVNPRDEFSQMLKDAWRYNRDYFYDPKMMGVDWNAVGKKYMDMIPFAGDRGDLDYVLGLMIGELGTGHAYVSPGFAGFDPMSPPPSMLGADFEAVGNNVRFRRILRGNGFDPSMSAPLGAAGVNVKEGEFLLEIDGKAVTRETGVSAHLLGKSGKRVTLTVNSTPSLTGARKVQVRPIPSETNLRYQTWVQERRALVAKASGGRLGYMHIPDTSVGGIIGFIDGFYSQTDKEGWVIDERYNGGGFIPTFFIEQLNRRMVSVFGPRHGRPEGLPAAFNGPKAMLINEHAGSGGDMLPYLFKREGLGPLIGTRTWGGLVGIQGYYDLVDGGGVTAPSFGIYDPKSMQWMAENRGVDPDIEVDDRPDLAARGQDVQLDRAIKWLMERLPAQRQDLRMPPMPRLGENGGGQ